MQNYTVAQLLRAIEIATQTGMLQDIVATIGDEPIIAIPTPHARMIAAKLNEGITRSADPTAIPVPMPTDEAEVDGGRLLKGTPRCPC